MATVTDIESFDNPICSDYHINILKTDTDEPTFFRLTEKKESRFFYQKLSYTRDPNISKMLSSNIAQTITLILYYQSMIMDVMLMSNILKCIFKRCMKYMMINRESM